MKNTVMKYTGERCVLGQTWDLVEKEHLARYEFALQYLGDKKVLDLGCGSGYGVDLIASKASEVIGVDISDEAISYSRQHYKKENIKFFVGDAANLHFFRDEEFDAVVSFEVIEHITTYLKFLKEIRRVLKNDGILIISTPNKKYHSPGSEKPRNIFHVIEFELDGFKKLLTEYFGDVVIYGQYYPSRIKELVKKLLPKRAWVALRTRAAGAYYAKKSSSFSDSKVESHSYFIAVCKK